MSLTLIIGPMFAGKTTALLLEVNRLSSIKKHILMINHSSDNRYGTDIVASHDNMSFPCIVATNLADVMKIKDTESSDVVAINEIQFFADARQYIEQFIVAGKKVIASGLSGDISRKIFPVIADLIPLADKIIHLTALCQECELICRQHGHTQTIQSEAPFTILMTAIVKDDQDDQDKSVHIEIGGTDKYKAVCGKHWKQM